MDEKKLITELLQAEEKQSGLLRVLVTVNIILAAVVLIICILLVPKTMSALRESQQAAAEMQKLSAAAQESLEGIDQVVEDNSANVEAALENFNSVDFEALNSAINDLADAVKPLAELSKLFN